MTLVVQSEGVALERHPARAAGGSAYPALAAVVSPVIMELALPLSKAVAVAVNDRKNLPPRSQTITLISCPSFVCIDKTLVCMPNFISKSSISCIIKTKLSVRRR